jgi:hypothetical protein
VDYSDWRTSLAAAAADDAGDDDDATVIHLLWL